MVDLDRSTQLTSGPELRDVASNRSEYEPKPGLHYLSTDTGARFIGDGERWNRISSTGANPSFRSLDTDELGNGHWRIHSGATGGDIQDVIDAASEGDLIVLELPDGGSFDTTVPIDVSTTPQLTIRGESLTASGRGPNNIYGCVIKQTTAGEDGIVGTFDQDGIHLENIGVQFASGLSSTGHGFNMDAPLDADGSAKKRGLFQATWDNLAAIDTDGDHYGYRIVNPQLNRFTDLRYYGGGSMELVNNHDSINMGDTHIFNLEGSTKAGTAHGLHFHAIESRINSCRFYSWVPLTDDTLNSTQKPIGVTEETGGAVAEMAFYAPLWENWTTDPETGMGFLLHGANNTPSGMDLSGFSLDQWVGSNTGLDIDAQTVKNWYITAELIHNTGRNGFSQSISGGATGPVTINLGGSVTTSSYSAHLEPDWQTNYVTSNKTSNSFDVTFGTAAPSGGGNVEGFVMGNF